ncbi:MAG: MiaB/RimO family radical SAM methylthiotransferase, partial [Deltaproteobacteria bacterium]|nr:MiaB/RimO family radical SAM methylthiotransferase [Deltaproteobacteria bacterium]
GLDGTCSRRGGIGLRPRVETGWWQGAGADPAARLPGEPVADTPTAFVTAMTGCDNRCSYCIVPTVRGHERSRPLAAIVDEVARLVEVGVREVTLLGQCVNAYGRGLPGGERFCDLLRAVAAVPGLHRLRFMTSHPRFFDDGLIDAFDELPRLADHVHLPVQSGSDRILAMMGRGYDRALVIDIVDRLRRVRSEIAITTDFIVGFPGETEDDFAQTVALVHRLQFDSMFSFAYSERPGTKAPQLADAVPRALRADRLARLHEAQRPYARRALERWVGHTVEVLAEGASSRDAAAKSGRTRQNIVVNFKGPALAGELAQVSISEAKANTLYGIERSPRMTVEAVRSLVADG